mgnify:FL=1|tara:strand:+ start:272 stop:565 length:294 start_codon:yes stop_codon:yes gene_type:complete
MTQLKKFYMAINKFDNDADEIQGIKGVYIYAESKDDISLYYEENLHIVHTTDAKAEYEITIDRSIVNSNDIAELESMLIKWASGEGFDCPKSFEGAK